MEMTIIVVLMSTTMKTIYSFECRGGTPMPFIYYEREDDGYAWNIFPTTTTKITMTMMRLGGMSKYGIIQ